MQQGTRCCTPLQALTANPALLTIQVESTRLVRKADFAEILHSGA